MIFSVKTTVGQENTVAELLSSKQRKENENINAIAVVSDLKGYVFIEADNKTEIKKLTYNAPHVKGIIEQEVDVSEITHFFEEKPLTTDIHQGDRVELIAGPFKGEKAKVVRIDDAKDKITLELIEATVPIPVTVDAASVRVLDKDQEN